MDTNPFNVVGDTASCHIAATIPDHYPVDCEGHVSFLDIRDRSVFEGGVGFADGRAELPDAPGLGITVNWAKLETSSTGTLADGPRLHRRSNGLDWESLDRGCP